MTVVIKNYQIRDESDDLEQWLMGIIRQGHKWTVLISTSMISRRKIFQNEHKPKRSFDGHCSLNHHCLSVFDNSDFVSRSCHSFDPLKENHFALKRFAYYHGW